MKKYNSINSLVLDIKNNMFIIYIFDNHISYFGKLYLNLNLIKQLLQIYKDVKIKIIKDIKLRASNEEIQIVFK